MEADPGSFRDPTSRVFDDGERVVRLLDAQATLNFEALERSSFYAQAIDDGRLIGTRRLAELPPRVAGEWTTALEHTRVPVISYPYEWSFSMLRAAALLTLDLTLAALDDGLITKDATPFNVQFVGSRPTFIDIGSFERLQKGEPWFGYRQFCEQLLNPLLLQARRDIDFRPLLRGSLRGISPAQTAAMLRLRDRARPSVFTHVSLHARLERRYARTERDVRADLKSAGFGPAIIRAQVQKLRKLVDRLRWSRSESTWSAYSERDHYEQAALDAKAEFVQRAASRRARRLVLDLGANDGYFSKLVLPHADHVVAVDGDPLVIDRLYGELATSGERAITPLVLDLADPSGALGWRNRERPSFAQRVRPDLVLCLAVVHHLAISDSIPLEEIVGWLRDFDAEVVVELPHPDDPKVEVLMRAKRDRRVERYDVTRFESAVDARFETVERIVLPSGRRTMYHLSPRA